MNAARAWQAAGAPPAEEPRGGRRRWIAATVTGVVVVAGAAGAWRAGVFGKSSSPNPTAGSSYHASTATVTQRTLTSQVQVNATLGSSGSYSIVNQVQGTITQLPATGAVIRQGHVMYKVSGSPVILLYGYVPAYRTLSDGMTGADVTELNAALVKLGYSSYLDPKSDYFSDETAYAVEKFQDHYGISETGVLTLGEVVFMPTNVQITGVAATTVLGGTIQAGTAVLTASSTSPIVTINLDPAQQTEVKVGDKVSIGLPNGQSTPGVISSVGTVATTTPGSSTASPSSTITVEVTPTNPKAVAGLSQAPVTVTITTSSVSNALVVPVTALLAQSGGGYAVEVVGAAGVRHLVPVSLGLFDDADGQVAVTGNGLAVGQHVVVPNT
jgi:peptidoglycan hydrolase-like protein with peptidoglycan-binding domain